MRRITSTDLENWAPTRDCQEHLPLFVRKLIRASPVTVLKMLFPAGDNVILPGYDGTLEVMEGTEYIPSGKSVWEVGSGKEFKEKADRDYKTKNRESWQGGIGRNSFCIRNTPCLVWKRRMVKRKTGKERMEKCSGNRWTSLRGMD
jgi:hypothetical protein